MTRPRDRVSLHSRGQVSLIVPYVLSVSIGLGALAFVLGAIVQIYGVWHDRDSREKAALQQQEEQKHLDQRLDEIVRLVGTGKLDAAIQESRKENASLKESNLELARELLEEKLLHLADDAEKRKPGLVTPEMRERGMDEKQRRAERLEHAYQVVRSLDPNTPPPGWTALAVRELRNELVENLVHEAQGEARNTSPAGGSPLRRFDRPYLDDNGRIVDPLEEILINRLDVKTHPARGVEGR
jgi:hypothetical protein